MKSKIRLSTFVFLQLVIFASCTFYSKEQKFPVVGCNAANIPSVSFSKNVIPIFQQNCATSNCHNVATHAGNLILDSAQAYTALLQTGKGYIDTLNPRSSLLYSQLISTVSPMPPTGKLDDCSIEIILKWMQQKAKNN
jgi:hypothetical protein